ncbi:hypothetical protein FOA52_007747 [Chlamydomonas sp. UWO 241]|nr:hypothetical protein FOA52_007747 [Chlamydomonas sp. UWO 241]
MEHAPLSLNSSYFAHPPAATLGHKKLTIAEIINGEPSIPLSVSDAAASFIRLALIKDKRKRPTVAKLLEHHWIGSVMKPAVPRRPEFMRMRMRAESFKERAVPAASAAGGDETPAQALEDMRITDMQTDRTLGHSKSLNAAAMMRWRDAAFNANQEGAVAFDFPEGVQPLTRASDGGDSASNSRRSSFASSVAPGTPGGHVATHGTSSGFSPAAVAAALARGDLSRQNSGLMSPGGGGGWNVQGGSMQMSGMMSPLPVAQSRDEMIRSLQESAKKLDRLVGSRNVGFAALPPPAAGSSGAVAQRQLLNRSCSTISSKGPQSAGSSPLGRGVQPPRSPASPATASGLAARPLTPTHSNGSGHDGGGANLPRAQSGGSPDQLPGTYQAGSRNAGGAPPSDSDDRQQQQQQQAPSAGGSPILWPVPPPVARAGAACALHSPSRFSSQAATERPQSPFASGTGSMKDAAGRNLRETVSMHVREPSSMIAAGQGAPAGVGAYESSPPRSPKDTRPTPAAAAAAAIAAMSMESDGLGGSLLGTKFPSMPGSRAPSRGTSSMLDAGGGAGGGSGAQLADSGDALRAQGVKAGVGSVAS